MAVNLYRRDVRFPPEINARLEVLKRELEEERGKPISMSRLVVEIVSQFMDSADRGSLSRGSRSALRKEVDNA